MDVAQAFIFEAGWIFFTAWGVVLAAFCAIAFGREIFGFNRGPVSEGTLS
jgi:hypothetical protein